MTHDEITTVAPLSGGHVLLTEDAVYFIGRDGIHTLRGSNAREIPYNVHLDRQRYYFRDTLDGEERVNW